MQQPRLSTVNLLSGTENDREPNKKTRAARQNIGGPEYARPEYCAIFFLKVLLAFVVRLRVGTLSEARLLFRDATSTGHNAR